jgi:hypothetical protein
MTALRRDQRASGAPDQRPLTPRRMVEWFSPPLLFQTGLQVLVWDFVGKGQPMEEAPRSWAVPVFAGHDLWFDYVADVADGWNPTFTIASLLAREELEAGGRALSRGRFFVLGGDEVYPAPTQRNYLERFVAPYTAAFPAPPPQGPAPVMLAIPGNHDWYDGLVSFSRQFTQNRSIGGWRTVQSQSYFALLLPHRWWLWAMDVLPGSEMDHGQRSYFQEVSLELAPGDGVILVAATPDWIVEDAIYREESHFCTVEDELITPRGAQVHLWLSGDLHHYRRHERRRPDGTLDPRFQRITSGGGGAYVSPTHRPGMKSVVVGRERQAGGRNGGSAYLYPQDDAPPEAESPPIQDEFVRRACFPSTPASFRLSLLNLALAFRAWKLGVFPFGVLYWLMTWRGAPADTASLAGWRDTFASPGLIVWTVVILAGFVLFADRTRPWFRWIGGLAHGIAHIVTIIVVTSAINATFLSGAVGPTDYVAANVLNFLAGVLVGPTVLGLYLLLSLTLVGAHPASAFSALAIQDYKHFLRLHIEADGTLEIFPIGVRRVARGRESRARYFLIEGPIVIER